MTATYQVVAECAHVTVSTPYGRMQTLMLKGALVQADAPELKRLLELGYVAETSSDETGGVDAAGVPAAAYDSDVPVAVTTTPVEPSEERKAQAAKVKADQDVAEKRAAAASKLPSDGSAPDGRASKEVLVEWLAGKGYSYDELVKQEPAELKAMIKQQS